MNKSKAVSWGARSLIVAHNHPSGDPTPSKNDIEVTRKLQEAAHVLDVRVLDHLVLGSPVSGQAGYVSVVEFMKECKNV